MGVLEKLKKEVSEAVKKIDEKTTIDEKIAGGLKKVKDVVFPKEVQKEAYEKLQKWQSKLLEPLKPEMVTEKKKLTKRYYVERKVSDGKATTTVYSASGLDYGKIVDQKTTMLDKSQLKNLENQKKNVDQYINKLYEMKKQISEAPEGTTFKIKIPKEGYTEVKFLKKDEALKYIQERLYEANRARHEISDLKNEMIKSQAKSGFIDVPYEVEIQRPKKWEELTPEERSLFKKASESEVGKSFVRTATTMTSEAFFFPARFMVDPKRAIGELREIPSALKTSWKMRKEYPHISYPEFAAMGLFAVDIGMGIGSRIFRVPEKPLSVRSIPIEESITMEKISERGYSFGARQTFEILEGEEIVGKVEAGEIGLAVRGKGKQPTLSVSYEGGLTGEVFGKEVVSRFEGGAEGKILKELVVTSEKYPRVIDVHGRFGVRTRKLVVGGEKQLPQTTIGDYYLRMRIEEPFIMETAEETVSVFPTISERKVASTTKTVEPLRGKWARVSEVFEKSEETALGKITEIIEREPKKMKKAELPPEKRTPFKFEPLEEVPELLTEVEKKAKKRKKMAVEAELLRITPERENLFLHRATAEYTRGVTLEGARAQVLNIAQQLRPKPEAPPITPIGEPQPTKLESTTMAEAISGIKAKIKEITKIEERNKAKERIKLGEKLEERFILEPEIKIGEKPIIQPKEKVTTKPFIIEKIEERLEETPPIITTPEIQIPRPRIPLFKLPRKKEPFEISGKTRQKTFGFMITLKKGKKIVRIKEIFGTKKEARAFALKKRAKMFKIEPVGLAPTKKVRVKPSKKELKRLGAWLIPVKKKKGGARGKKKAKKKK